MYDICDTISLYLRIFSVVIDKFNKSREGKREACVLDEGLRGKINNGYYLHKHVGLCAFYCLRME